MHQTLGDLDLAAKTMTTGFADLLDAVLTLRSGESDPTESLVGLTGVAGAYRAGVIAIDDLAGFVRTTRQLHGPVLADVDEQAAALADRHARHGLAGGWLAEIEILVADLRAPGWARRQEARASHGMSASIQTDFDTGDGLAR